MCNVSYKVKRYGRCGGDPAEYVEDNDARGEESSNTGQEEQDSKDDDGGSSSELVCKYTRDKRPNHIARQVNSLGEKYPELLTAHKMKLGHCCLRVYLTVIVPSITWHNGVVHPSR